jgi:V/A-type H+-transporting ATPase subunit I
VAVETGTRIATDNDYNMFMNILGAMVHPMRLTFVEFFKNSGYEGGGKEYKPFKN